MSHKPAVMTIIEKLLAHQLNMTDAVDSIDALYNPASDTGTVQSGEFYHWADCSTKGIAHVYHASACEGGEDCRLFKYLDAPGGAEKHLKRGHEYTVTEDSTGKFIFTETGKSNDKKALAKKGTQASLL